MVAWVSAFGWLETRMGMTFDLLEHEGRDVRQEPLSWRREQLATVIGNARS